MVGNSKFNFLEGFQGDHKVHLPERLNLGCLHVDFFPQRNHNFVPKDTLNFLELHIKALVKVVRNLWDHQFRLW